MRIEITEKGSDAYTREVVNFYFQATSIQKNSEYRPRNLFKDYTVLLILSASALALVVAVTVMKGFDFLSVLGLVILGLGLAFSVIFLISLNKSRKRLNDDEPDVNNPTFLTLDDSGVELSMKGGKNVFKSSWDNIMLVNVAKETVMFLPADENGIVFFTSKKYEPEITDWILNNRPSVRIVRQEI